MRPLLRHMGVALYHGSDYWLLILTSIPPVQIQGTFFSLVAALFDLDSCVEIFVKDIEL